MNKTEKSNLQPATSNARAKSELTWPHENLEVWRLSMELIPIVYRLTAMFPKDERFGLTDQTNRAVVAIALLIAEGKGLYSQNSFLEFLYKARGSLYETVTCLTTAENLGYITSQDRQKATDLAFTIQSKLAGLINAIKDSSKKRS